jgi:hypothetical protein
LISEIMYDPASPEPAWEWVEVYNNTGSTIDFDVTPYVFDDDDDASFTAANITSGTVANGATAVLFDAAGSGNTLANMTAAWGSGINFIPVSTWTNMANDGDTIAIWSSLAAYQGETQSTTSPRRTTNNAAAVVAYDDDTMADWPNNHDASSIFLESLTADPAAPASWTRSDSMNSVGPQPVLDDVVDHPGGDVGSPGFVPGTAVMPVPGDYNESGMVDAGDYVVWRNALGSAVTLPNDPTPGSVTPTDYDVWRANFGRSAASGAALRQLPVPEPVGIGLALLGFGWRLVTPRRWRPAPR